MRRRHAVLTALAALAALLVTGCNTEAGSSSDATIAVGNTVGSIDVSAPARPMRDPGTNDSLPDTVPVAGPSPATDFGTCSVQVTGNVVAGWSTAATADSITFGAWLNAAALQATTGDTTPIDPGYFLLTCRGAGDRSISFSGNGSVPQRATTYRLTLDRSGSGQSPDDRIAVVLSVPDTGVLALAGEGSLVITRFDDTGIAGSFDVPFVDQQGGASRATGQFDLINPEPRLVPSQGG
jgi:predicted small secreted protein